MLALQIVQAAVKPNVTVNELVAVCQHDPAFVMRMLSHLNSSTIGMSRRVSSVQQGVSLLGVRGIRNLALSMCVSDLSPPDADGNALLALCLRRAVAGKLIAQKLGRGSPDDCFTACMLLEVGLLIRAREDMKDAARIGLSAANMRVMLERGAGIEDHPHRGGRLARTWGLDAEIAAAITHHHDAEPPRSDVGAVAWLAERVAAVFEGGDVSQNRVDALQAASRLKLAPADVDELLKTLPAKVDETATDLNRNVGPQPDIDVLLRDANAALVEINRSYAELVHQLGELVKERERLADELREANVKLSTLAMTDSLTGLANRRAFDDVLVRDLARTERQGGEMSLVLLDVDHFKRVNDTYGHPTGDLVLQMIAGGLKECTRVSDVAARVGGEELALILPQTPAERATIVAERVRQWVADRPITALDGRSVRVTVSLGIAGVKAPGCRNLGQAIYDAADRALFEAKRSGRNRWVISTG